MQAGLAEEEDGGKDGRGRKGGKQKAPSLSGLLTRTNQHVSKSVQRNPSPSSLPPTPWKRGTRGRSLRTAAFAPP